MSSAWKNYHFETRAIHAGQEPDPTTGAIIVPIHQTSTYVQEASGQHKGYEYSRTANPTRSALETCLASLEEAGSGGALAFASGMAAIATCLYLLRAGEHVLAGDDAYGGTYRLFQQVLTHYGLSFSYVDLSDLEAARSALRPNTRMIWVENPTNPLLKIVDLRALSALAHSAGAWLAVDNTFATPYLQRPLSLGTDLVVYSTTKYLGGHSDVVGGAIVTGDQELYQRLKFLQNAAGMVPGPLDSWLVLRGLKTLAVRMQAHQANAMEVAHFLSKHPRVVQVYYPGLPHHPGHDLAKQQMDGFGGMVSFELAGSANDALGVAARTKVFALAESLGGVESLIEHPASMTHASVRGSPLQVSDRLLRLSVGIENIQDLISDLQQALAS